MSDKNWLGSLLARFGVGQRTNRDAEVERELEAHLELESEEQQDSGLPPEEARYAARRAFGNTTLVREDVREIWNER
jgi:hypothetical protein